MRKGVDGQTVAVGQGAADGTAAQGHGQNCDCQGRFLEKPSHEVGYRVRRRAERVNVSGQGEEAPPKGFRGHHLLSSDGCGKSSGQCCVPAPALSARLRWRRSVPMAGG